MSNKQALRDLQTRLADRLQAAKTQERGEAWLAVECGTRGFLFPLREAGEIFPMTVIAPVPHSHHWFLGVANLRGHLHGVVDLADFLGVKAAATLREQCRLVGFSQSLGLNCALMVDRLAGLRSESELTPEPATEAGMQPAFAGQRLRDSAGRIWQELNLAELATEEAFLKVVG
jgi:twitching motility protein PilI